MKSIIFTTICTLTLASCGSGAGSSSASGAGGSTSRSADGKNSALPTAAETACSQKAAKALHDSSQSGYRTWQRLEDKSVFNFFAGKCDDGDDFYESDLPTAVHESNHAIRAQTEAYHLVSDEMLAVPPAANYYAPEKMASALLAKVHIPKDDDYYTIYIAPTSDASSKDDFTYLLDELNAYTNDQQVSTDLANANVFQMNYRQIGLPAMLTYVSFYANYAKENEPETWTSLSTNPKMRAAMLKLWTQGEDVLKKACEKQPNAVTDDSYYMSYLCDAQQTVAISTVLGRPVQCPTACQ